jgi:uncharacterized membrane protein
MKPPLAKLVLEIRTGFWALPLLMLAAGVGLGLIAVWLDEALIGAGHVSSFGRNASPSGARSLLSVAAGALATTLAISLSMTMVTVQLASSQYTPRLLRRFLGDRFTQGVIGGFLGTIAYLLLVLRAVRSPDEGAAFVPPLSLSAAVLLTLTCLGLLVVFLHRTMRTMQASTIIARVGRETIQMIRALEVGALAKAPPLTEEPTCVISSTLPGYIQLIDDKAVRLAIPDGATMACRDASPGDFVLIGAPLLSLYGPCGDLGVDSIAKIRACFAIGTERTTNSDMLFGIRQLVDVALKALSPGINDVTTAVMVVNELGAVLQAVASMELPADGWCVVAGERRPYRWRTLDLDGCLELSLGEIEAASQDHPRVRIRMLDLLSSIRNDARTVAADGALARWEAQIRRHLSMNTSAAATSPLVA